MNGTSKKILLQEVRNMKKQHIIFDLDDTLSYCNKYFSFVIQQFMDQMAEYFAEYSIDKVKFREKQLEIDLASIATAGLSSERFPDSFVQTYEYFCELTGRQKEKAEANFLRKLGESVFTMEVEPLPKMYETLETLKEEGHELYLYTGGDEVNQYRKINQLELGTYFQHRIFVSVHKDTKALGAILTEIQADRENTWMIGNSLRTDIKPALELGINAIYIPAEEEWQYNIVDIDIEPQSIFLTLPSLEEVPEAIHKHMGM
jgi:putative hydrolase of the HAD superfamily